MVDVNEIELSCDHQRVLGNQYISVTEGGGEEGEGGEGGEGGGEGGGKGGKL